MSDTPKVSWRHSLGNLDTKAYFEACNSPHDFDYVDFFAVDETAENGQE